MSGSPVQARVSRALIVVWDGMRPDLADRDLTPNLSRLADDGVWFERSHAVFPTVTRVNAATIASGSWPSDHGLPGNLLYAPLVDPAGPISFGEGDSFAALTRAYDVFRAPTIADVVAGNGGRTVVASNGTRGAALMCHPTARRHGDLLLHPTLSQPRELGPFVERLGPLPPAAIPDTARNRWFARAAAEIILPELRPDLLVVWSNDPDKSQHCFGFGHPESLRSIREVDEDLGLMLDALDGSGQRAETAVAVVSDHGYVSVGARVDLAAALVEAGLKADRTSTDVVVAPNGSAVSLYLPGAGSVAAGLVDFLHAWAPAAVVFSGAPGRTPLDGTLPLEAVGGGGPLAPDLLVALDWSDATNEHGYAGRSAENGSTNLASHGGLSSWEIRNTLLLAGPGLRGGFRDPLPVGNVDLAPTLLQLLGLPIPPTMRGRVLAEALAAEDIPDPTVTHEVVAEAYRGGRYELVYSVVDGHRYLDQGQGTNTNTN